MRSPYEIFNENIDRAERILLTFEVKKRLDEFPRLLRQIPPAYELRNFLSERVDQIIDVAKPLLLVFANTCLEHYLESVGEKKKLVYMIDDWKVEAGEKLVMEVHEIRKKRNIIVHNAQHIPELGIGEMRGMLENIRKYVKAVERALGHDFD